MYYKKDGEVVRSGFGFGGVKENFGFGFDNIPWITVGISVFAILVVLWLFLTLRSKY